MLAYKTAVSKSIINVFLYSLTYLLLFFLFMYLSIYLTNELIRLSYIMHYFRFLPLCKWDF